LGKIEVLPRINADDRGSGKELDFARERGEAGYRGATSLPNLGQKISLGKSFISFTVENFAAKD